MRYTNAGHNSPLLLRSGGHFDVLGPTGIASGVLEDARYRDGQVVIDPGDCLVCYTDGITEAINNAEEEYGVQRLQDVVRRFRDRPSAVIVQSILSDVAAHTGDRIAFDDVTLLVLKRREV